MKRAAFQYSFFKINTGPDGHIGQKFVDGALVSKIMRVMDQNFNRIFTSGGKHVGCPIDAASGIFEQGIFHVHYNWFVFTFTNSQINVICIEGNGQVSAVKTNILAVRGQHVEITPQGHISFCGRDVLPADNFLPGSICDPILTVKINFSEHSAHCLVAAGFAGP